MKPVDLNQIVDELYGIAPADFTARRDQLSAEAKKAGDRDLAAAIKALRRPSAAAFAVNLMARTRGDRIDALIELGGQMKAAQDALSGEELRALGRQRSLLIHAVTQEVRSVAHGAGHPVSDAVAREIETTLEAAFADAWAGQAVRQGRLIRALERSGLGPVELEGAVAGTPSAPSEASRPRTEKAAAKVAEASEAAAVADRADRRAAETAEQLAAAIADHEAAVRRRDEAESAARRREEELRVARAAADDAAGAETQARRARRDAEQVHEEAAGAAQRARAAADALRLQPDS